MNLTGDEFRSASGEEVETFSVQDPVFCPGLQQEDRLLEAPLVELPAL